MKNRSGQIIILWLFLLPSMNQVVNAQNQEYITGKIINSATSSPVPFATIKLKNNNLGVYANAEGDFRISRNTDFAIDSVIITCIGYKRFSLAYSDFNETEANRILLTPIVYGLHEVKVEASRRIPGPLAVIRKAIRYIYKNFPDKPYNYIAYYRDYQKKDSTYLNLNEAIVQTFDGGFGTSSFFNLYRLLDFRQNNEFPRIEISPYYDVYKEDQINSPYKVIPKAMMGDQYGNELFILLVHDALRNYNKRSFSFVEKLSEDFIGNHVFANPVTVLNNNLVLYKISFTAKKFVTGDSLSVAGAIYIQPRDYSIHKLEYTAYYKNKNKTLKPAYNIDIEYGYENSADSKMCLRYISFNNIFKVTDPMDENYFRVLSSGWDTLHKAKTTIDINFNHEIDPKSASKKDNYVITLGKKTLKIQGIQVVGRKLFIRLRDEDILGKKEACRINIYNLKDTRGKIIDQRKTVELYQYRELFVQDYNKTLPYSDSCFIMMQPLNQNCISKVDGTLNYWMNTPENITNRKK